MNRLFISTFLGFLFGLLCAYSSTIFQPVGPPTFWGLIATVYNRTLIGFLIGLERSWRPEWLKGMVIGTLVSWAMTLSYGPFGLLFGVPGAIIGGIIGFVVELRG